MAKKKEEKKKNKDEDKEKDERSLLNEIIKYDNLNIKLNFLKTQIDIIDAFFGGERDLFSNDIGIAIGKLIGIAGDNGVGKSTLMMEISKRFCRQGRKVLFVDVEDGLNVKSLVSYGLLEYAAYNPEIKNETNIKKIIEMRLECLRQFISGEKLFYAISPKTYTTVMQGIRKVFKANEKGSGGIKLIVVDSVKQIKPQAIFNEEGDEHIEDQKMMINASSQENFFPTLKNFTSVNETCCILLQQFRTAKKGSFFVLDEAGGQAWRHGCDIRMIMKEKEKIFHNVKNNLGELIEKRIGNWVNLEIRKGRFGNPFTKLSLPLIFGKGISLIYLYARCLENTNTVIQSGSWYTFSIPELDILEKYQGSGKTFKIIKANFVKIEEYIRTKGLLFVESSIEEDNEE